MYFCQVDILDGLRVHCVTFWLTLVGLCSSDLVTAAAVVVAVGLGSADAKALCEQRLRVGLVSAFADTNALHREFIEFAALPTSVLAGAETHCFTFAIFAATIGRRFISRCSFMASNRLVGAAAAADARAFCVVELDGYSALTACARATARPTPFTVLAAALAAAGTAANAMLLAFCRLAGVTGAVAVAAAFASVFGSRTSVLTLAATVVSASSLSVGGQAATVAGAFTDDIGFLVRFEGANHAVALLRGRMLGLFAGHLLAGTLPSEVTHRYSWNGR